MAFDVLKQNYLSLRMMKATGFLIFTLLLALVLPMGLAAEETRSMTLNDCVQQALLQNLEVQIERQGPLIAGYNVRLARAGYDPVLNLSGQHDFNRSAAQLSSDNQIIFGTENEADRFSGGLSGLTPWGMTYALEAGAADRYGFSDNPIIGEFENATGFAQFRVTQPLLQNLWIDSTRLNIAVSKNQLKQSEAIFRLRVMDIVKRVEDTYFDLIFSSENVKVQQLGLDLARQLLADNKKRVEVGAMAPLDEKQAEADAAAREADLLAAQRSRSTQENILKSLLTDSYAYWQSITIEPAEELAAPVPFFDVQDSWNKGLELRPELQQSMIDVETQGIQLRYDKNQMFPQIDVFGTYGRNASALELSGIFSPILDGTDPHWTAGGSLSVPLTRSGARNRLRANKAVMEQLVLGLKQTEQTIMVEIDNAIKQAETSFRRVGATRQARAYAEAALDAEQQKLANGKSTSFVVLQLQRDLTSARFNEISALTEYNKSLAALARSEGSTLERHYINLDVND